MKDWEKLAKALVKLITTIGSAVMIYWIIKFTMHITDIAGFM